MSEELREEIIRQHERVERAAALVRDALNEPSSERSARLAQIPRDLRDVPMSVNSEGQLFALTGICRYFQDPEQDSAQALEAAVLLGNRALALGRPHERLSALMVQALIHDELDNHLEALEAYAAALAVAREIGLLRAEVATLAMAAQTLRHAGDPAGANAVANQALVVGRDAQDIDDLRALAWTTIAQWRLCVEDRDEGLSAVSSARRCVAEDADPGLRSTLDYTELLLQLLAGTTEPVPALLASLDRHAKQTRTVGAALSYTAARGAVDLVNGAGRARLVAALEKARRLPRALPDVLLGALIAHVVIGDSIRAGQLREELRSLFEARRSAGQLKATLMRGPVVGLGELGHAFNKETYERRLAVAQESLLASRSF